MKRVFRLVVIVALVISCAFLVSGCSNAKNGKCDNCRQTEKLNRYVDPGNGAVYWLCDTCYNLAKATTWH